MNYNDILIHIPDIWVFIFHITDVLIQIPDCHEISSNISTFTHTHIFLFLLILRSGHPNLRVSGLLERQDDGLIDNGF